METDASPTAVSPGANDTLPGFLLGNLRQNESRPPMSPVETFSPVTHYQTPRKSVTKGPPLVSLYDVEELDSSQRMEISTDCPIVPTQPQSDGYWVTVFGFPASAGAHVKLLFSQLGHILDSKYPANGNWVHFKYSTKSEARCALACHCRIVKTPIKSFIIGVFEGDISNLRPFEIVSSNPSINTTIPKTPNSPFGAVPPVRHLGTPASPPQPVNHIPMPRRDQGFAMNLFNWMFGV